MRVYKGKIKKKITIKLIGDAEKAFKFRMLHWLK